MNKVGTKENYVRLFQGLIADRALQNDMDIAATVGDAYNYKNAEFLSLANMVDMFARTGRMNDLKIMLNDSFDLNDDNDLTSIIENTTSIEKKEDGTEELSGPFVENGNKLDIQTEDGKKKVKDILSKQKAKIQDVIDSYESISQRLDNMPGQHFTDEQREELMWLHLQLDNWRKRGLQMTEEEILPPLKKIRENLIIKRDKIAEISENDDLNKEELDKVSEILNSANSIIKFLDRIVDSKSDNVAQLLLADVSKFDKNLGIYSNIQSILNSIGDKYGLDISEISATMNSLEDLNINSI